MSEQTVSPRTYVLTAAWLMALLVVTVVVAYIPLGPFGPVAAMLIAGTKAALIAVLFMHLRWDSPMMRLFAAAGLLWLALLIGGTMNDYLTRSGPPFILEEHPGTVPAQDPGTTGVQPVE